MINLHLDIDIRTLSEDEAKKKIDNINLVAEHFCAIKFFEEAKYCADNALNMAEAIDYHKGIAQAKYTLGFIFSRKEDYSSAISVLIEAEKISAGTKDLKCLGETCHLLGFCYWNIGDYSNEIEAFFKAVSIFNQAGMRAEEANSLNSIGNFYLETKEHDLALDYYSKSISIKKEIRDIHGIIFSLFNIALTFNNIAAARDAEDKNSISEETALNLYNKALKYYFAALDFNTKLERDEFLEHRILQNIGLTYTNTYRQKEALEIFLKNIEYYTKTGNEVDKCDTLIYLSITDLSLGKIEEAELTLRQAEEIAERLNIKRLILHVCRDFATHYERRKMFKEALFYHRKYSALELERTKTIVEDNIRKLNILHTVDLTKKETQILSEKNEQLQILNNDLVKLNNDKNYFLNLVANDLRNPLEKISEKINKVRFGKKEVKHKELTEILIESSHMQNIISELLTLNESQSAK